MSLASTTEDHLVHFPSNPDKFEFDGEVAAAFPDMSVRSIPCYREAHYVHASLLKPTLLKEGDIVLVDVGASRGYFFEEVCKQLQHTPKDFGGRVVGVAIDSSQAMLDRLSADMPWVQTVLGDITCMPDLEVQADAICMMYVLQFIQSTEDKYQALRWAFRNLKPGGSLFLGQKEEPSSTYRDAFSEQYYAFRRDNGYTQAEIDAKTKALANSMWPISKTFLEDLCYNAGFIDYAETTRWLHFSTAICTKDVDHA